MFIPQEIWFTVQLAIVDCCTVDRGLNMTKHVTWGWVCKSPVKNCESASQALQVTSLQVACLQVIGKGAHFIELCFFFTQGVVHFCVLLFQFAQCANVGWPLPPTPQFAQPREENQGSHYQEKTLKTWKMVKAFSRPGKVREKGQNRGIWKNSVPSKKIRGKIQHAICALSCDDTAHGLWWLFCWWWRCSYIKGALYGFSQADVWWLILAVLDIGYIVTEDVTYISVPYGDLVNT